MSNPYNRPPGSSRCPHSRGYNYRKLNARATGMYCRQCNQLSGWWTDAQDKTNYEATISGEPTKLTTEEKRSLR